MFIINIDESSFDAQDAEAKVKELGNYPAPLFVNSQTDKANKLW